jgi:hypothetical protein
MTKRLRCDHGKVFTPSVVSPSPCGILPPWRLAPRRERAARPAAQIADQNRLASEKLYASTALSLRPYPFDSAERSVREYIETCATMSIDHDTIDVTRKHCRAFAIAEPSCLTAAERQRRTGAPTPALLN